MTQHYTTPQLASNSTTPSKLVVMLHGVGSNGDDLISLAPFIQMDFPTFHFISPNGTEKYDMAPFGYQWFSLRDRTNDVIMKQVEKNKDLVEKIITTQQDILGLSNKDTILLGFSQGTMMASYLTLQAEDPYHAMIGFSGRLVAPQEAPKNKRTPICLIHGLDDIMVPATESEDFQKYCLDNTIECALKLIPNLSHSIDHTGLEFAKDFIKKREK